MEGKSNQSVSQSSVRPCERQRERKREADTHPPIQKGKRKGKRKRKSDALLVVRVVVLGPRQEVDAEAREDVLEGPGEGVAGGG